MLALLSQRDVMSSFKKETCLNVSILSKIHAMPGELARQIFKDDALEKPTQSVFLHLSHYLVCIVDAQKAATLPWPLYDTGAEKKYRNEFSSFVLEYSKQGLLTPVMSSYFVNPACYKVNKLMFQLSQLAVQRALKAKMVREQQKELYEDVSKKYKSSCKDFLVNIEKETKIMMGKFNTYKRKKETVEQISEMLREKIKSNEAKLEKIEKQGLVRDLVKSFIKNHELDSGVVDKLNLIMDPNQPAPFFDEWLEQTDREIDLLESKWNEKVGSFTALVKSCKNTTECLISKHTGEMDRKAYVVEYDPKTDKINTKDLEAQVNSEQKYILKNILIENRLNFPNLVKGFVISICFILKNSQVSNDIFKFNEYLETEKQNYKEMSMALRILLDRVMNADEKLEPQPIQLFHNSIPAKEFSEIPPLPDLSDLKTCPEHITTAFDTFTPINISKHQFNLRRKASVPMFVKPQPKSLITPLHQGDDFLKTLISCRTSTYDKPNSTHNMSTISQAANRINETIAECSSGFTKQQIQRLLSTKKGSSTKKVKFSTDRPNIKVKKGGLFNETAENILFRSHSSPNLFENKEKRSRLKGKQLSVMQEDIPALLEVSGISVIENNSGCGAPENIIISLDSTKLDTPTQVPAIKISSDSVEKRLKRILKETEEINAPKLQDSPILLEVSDISAIENNSGSQTQEVIPSIDAKRTKIPRPYQTPVAKIATDFVEKKLNNILKQTENINITLSPSFTEQSPNFSASSSNITPKTINPIRRTSSIEKIINRFKKVRANVVTDKDDSTKDFDTIQEEKENLNTVNVDVFTANKMLLPDLVSPNYSLVNKPNDFLDDLCFDIEEKEYRKPRESLGTALGVDQTFLDQFDLID